MNDEVLIGFAGSPGQLCVAVEDKGLRALIKLKFCFNIRSSMFYYKKITDTFCRLKEK
jgi:hypothetical protein